ncbi:MAG: nucleotidyltransferase family protein, partial [Bacilli bacterium]|nr:nucleotidyltransferase family protein [Bacilli bacterium]
EGLDQRIRKEILKHDNLDDFVKAVKTKRYTYNKIMRMLCHILCSFTKEEASKCLEPAYLRILGMNQVGRKYLKQLKKEVTLPLITACTETNHLMMDIEFRSTCAFASLLSLKEKKAIIHREFIKKPIIVKEK